MDFWLVDLVLATGWVRGQEPSPPTPLPAHRERGDDAECDGGWGVIRLQVVS